MNYQNIPQYLGMLISTKQATLHELETIYSVEDAYLMLEVIMIDRHNQNAMSKAVK